MRITAWTGGVSGRGVLIVVSWSASISAITGQALFRQALLGPLDLFLIVTLSAFGGALLSDLGRAILGSVASMATGFATVYFLAILPSFTGAVGATDAALLQQLWVGVMFRALFPFPVMGLIVASLIGGALGERFL